MYSFTEFAIFPSSECFFKNSKERVLGADGGQVPADTEIIAHKKTVTKNLECLQYVQSMLNFPPFL